MILTPESRVPMTRRRLTAVLMLVALAACFLGLLIFTPATPEWLVSMFRR